MAIFRNSFFIKLIVPFLRNNAGQADSTVNTALVQTAGARRHIGHCAARRVNFILLSQECGRVARRRAMNRTAVGFSGAIDMKGFLHPVRKKMKAAIGGVMESLESRTLFNATLTSPISNLSVTQDSAPTVIPLDPHFTDPLVSGTTIIISTPQGPIPIELSDGATPQTVAAFLGHIQ